MKRMKKVAFLSVFIELLMYLVFGLFLYYCFGNENMVDLIILREPYEGKAPFTEWIVIGLILIFFLMNNVGLSTFNPGLKSYLKKFISFNSKRLTHLVTSLLPMFLAFLVAIVFPNILGMFWIIGLIICNFNGFIIPAWMRLKIL